MSSTKKTILVILTAIAGLVSVFQGFIPTMPVTDPEIIKIVSSGALFLATFSTVWIQYLSDNIANKAIKRTLFVALIATITGLLDFSGVIHFSTSTGQWVRFGFQLVIAFLTFYSKQLFPSESQVAKNDQAAQDKLQAK